MFLKRIKKRVCKCLLVMLIVAMVLPISIVWAEYEASVLQAYVTEQTMTIITDVELSTYELSALVSNQEAEIIGTGALSDSPALVRTTILVDISTSIPSAVHDNVTELLNSMIENKQANEEFKVVTFGDELVTLHDFTTDRFDLTRAIEDISFENALSRVYEAVFETIPLISRHDSRPTFYRTILITHEIDDAATGITREELFIRLQNERYPIDVISVGSAETEENNELAAISRISDGRYFAFNPNSDVNEIVGALAVSEFFYFEAIVPSQLLDGTTRQVDISDGTRNISIDVRFPVWDDPYAEVTPPDDMDEEEPVEEENNYIPEEPEPEPESEDEPELPSEEADTDTTFFEEHTVAVVVISIIALIIAVGLILFIVIRNKKKKSEQGNSSKTSNENINEMEDNKTEFVSISKSNNLQFTVKISYLNDPSKAWTLPVTKDLFIGRAEHCQIQLSDKSISREHCKIVVKDNGLALVHLASTNKTMLNGTNVAVDSPLKSGDTIKIGRVTLRVNYIQTTGG